MYNIIIRLSDNVCTQTNNISIFMVTQLNLIIINLSCIYILLFHIIQKHKIFIIYSNFILFFLFVLSENDVTSI